MAFFFEERGYEALNRLYTLPFLCFQSNSTNLRKTKALIQMNEDKNQIEKKNKTCQFCFWLYAFPNTSIVCLPPLAFYLLLSFFLKKDMGTTTCSHQRIITTYCTFVRLTLYFQDINKRHKNSQKQC